MPEVALAKNGTSMASLVDAIRPSCANADRHGSSSKGKTVFMSFRVPYPKE